ncbi:MAG: hypothetical protein ACP5G1_00040 [Nanopusillaceae archaeon]
MLDWVDIKNHYMKKEVMNEIIEYSKNRWIAIETSRLDQRVFIRYDRDKRPLKIENEDEYKSLFVKFSNLKFRTIYATINIYNEIKEEKLKDINNIRLVTPVFDIDGTLEDFEIIKNVAEIIISYLEKYNIYKSVYLKWSGRGIHIHINENAFSKNILNKYHPLDIAFSVVDFIIKKAKNDLEKEISKAKGKSREFKVENKIDIQRVFTVPLSFHRFLDYVCVVFKPNDLNNFDLSWADYRNYKHDKSWREYEEGEGDYLAELSIKESKGYIKDYLTKSTIDQTKISINKKNYGNVGRFQIMALLQAARYYLLYGDLNKAKSFGLNRAIFYAWAKYYRPVYGRSKRKIFFGKGEKNYSISKDIEFIKVGNEEVPYNKITGFFHMGDKDQTPEDYDKEVKDKIDGIIDYEKAWNFALEYLKKFPKSVLENQQEFYKRVYEPIRDRFLEELIKRERSN